MTTVSNGQWVLANHLYRMYEEDGPGYNLIHEEFTPARPTSLPISSSTGKLHTTLI